MQIIFLHSTNHWLADCCHFYLDTVQLRVSSPPQAPARHKRSPVAKSKAHSPSAATSSPSSKLTGSTPVTDDTILPAKSAQSSLNVTG